MFSEFYFQGDEELEGWKGHNMNIPMPDEAAIYTPL